MDPSPAQQWRSSVDNSIARLDAGMNEIISMLRTLSPVSVQAPPQPAAINPHTVSTMVKEPKLTPPELFKGDPDQCRAFLTQCEIHFELQPSSFPTERSRVAFVISLLSGKAKQWGTAEWQNNSVSCSSYSEFSKELIRVFDPVLPNREAARRLYSLRQGERSVTSFIIDFHVLAADSSWNQEALMDAFMEGLNDNIKDQLATQAYPKSLKELEDLATQIDLRLTERRRERRHREVLSTPASHSGSHPWLRSSPPASQTSNPEPMQLGRTKVSLEERSRRKQLNLCFYCGGQGHVAAKCPLKGQAQ